MNTDNASLYVKWLKQEVAPALGCTEPVAISFAAAYAAQYLDQPCTKISGFISANLYKNAMGVTIPGTTVCGVPLAAAIGAFGGDPQGNDSNLLIVFYVQIMPDDLVMQLHRF